MKRLAYPSDLSDREWQLLEPLCHRPNRAADPSPTPVGRSAIRYVLRTGCSWRMLPHDLQPWRVFHYFSTCNRHGDLATGT